MIPEGHTIEDIKTRERIIRMVSIVETNEHAAKNYLSTLAVLQLDSILTGARKVSVKKPKPAGNANQKPFERIMIMEYELTRIGKINISQNTISTKKASRVRCLTFTPYVWRRCIKMGIPSLNSAILYCVKLYFHCHLERASYCHFERAKRVEKSKLGKYNKYPGPHPQKRPFYWTAGSF